MPVEKTQLDLEHRNNLEFSLDDFLSEGSEIETGDEEVQEEVTQVEPAEEVEQPSVLAQEPEVVPDETEDTVPQINEPTVYAELLRDYIGAGDWEDAIVEIDGEEIRLTEIDNLDKDTFLSIKKTQKEIAKEKNSGKYIDSEGLSETDKKLIELKKSGGDWTHLLQQEAEVVHPLRGLNLEDESVQLYLVSEQYKSQGMEPEAIEVQLATDKKNFRLDQKAKHVVDTINASFDKLVESQNQKKQEEIQAKQQAQKELAKNLSDYYKGLELKSQTINRYVDVATKATQGGKTKLDELIESTKNDPERLAKLTFFLEDEKGFMEFNGAKERNKDKLRTIKLISDTASKDKDISKSEKKEDSKDPWSNIVFKKPEKV